MVPGLLQGDHLPIPLMHGRVNYWIQVAGSSRVYIHPQFIVGVEYYRDRETGICTDVVYEIVDGSWWRFVEFSLDEQGEITQARVERPVSDAPTVSTIPEDLDGLTIPYDGRGFQYAGQGKTDMFVLGDGELTLVRCLSWVAFVNKSDEGVVRKLIYAREVENETGEWEEVYYAYVFPKENALIFVPIIYPIV